MSAYESLMGDYASLYKEGKKREEKFFCACDELYKKLSRVSEEMLTDEELMFLFYYTQLPRSQKSTKRKTQYM